jgi:TolB-like protein
MRLLQSMIVGGAAAVLAGCATGGTMNADGVARLESARAARPNDAAVARSLGIAYYKQGKLVEARQHLDQAVRLDPRDGAASLYLGLTAEHQKDLPAAKAAYQTYVRFGRTSKVRRQLEARLAALTRQELEAAAKSAVAAEQQLVTQAGSATTVAVMPLRFTGSDSSLQPLERGLAELITIDLSRSSRLTVVERARLQALLDEIKLQQSGATDTTTNVRAGRIIQAGSLVNGSILQDGQRLRVDAAIVNTQTSQASGGASSENTLEQLFAIEKAIVLKLFEDLGVVLTTAERQAIEERPTRSMQAFLAYSKGLQLEDEGKFSEAALSFNDALRLDPSFGAAAQKGRETGQAALGMTMTVASVEQNTTTGTPEGNIGRQSEQGGAPQSTGNPSENSPRNQADNINQSSAGGATAGAGAGSSSGTTNRNTANRDALSSATGSESGRSTTRLTVVIRLPR